ncbi:MAG: lytic transglycosylase domain-containing protein [Alphaproteobacteria bacterium]|nr:lytic transglycosylase domain-containing protein [Alphaproteobacteria bacterium]
MNLVIKAIEIPLNIPTKYSRFQKLSLFIRESIKPAFSWFGIFSSNCLSSFLSLKGFVKSCISNTDYQFYILAIILSGNRALFKGITGTILFLSLLILWNTGAYATDINSSKSYWLKQYIATVERKNEIPRGLLSAIVSIESGFNPTAINIDGKPVIANNKSEAIKIIKNAVNQGVTNVDVGIAQINYRWHKDNFKNIEEMINPTANIEYAAKLLSSLFKHHGTWHKAIRHYHSANPNHHNQYSRKVVIAWLGNSQLIK